MVVTAAGTITGNSVFNGRTEGQTVELEYGRPGPDGAAMPAGRVLPYDLGPIPSWRNLRFDRNEIPADATYVRVIAEDNSLTPGTGSRSPRPGAGGPDSCRSTSARSGRCL